MISVFLWSELIFLTLVLTNFYLAINQNKKYYFIALILTGFLLCLQRNAGLFYTSGLCLGLLVNNPTLKNTGRLINYFLLSTSGLWAWNIYATYLATTDFHFYDHAFFDGFWSNIVLFMKALGKYTVPIKSTPALLLFTLILSGLIAFRIDKQRRILIIIILVYITCFSVLGQLSVDDIDRYLSAIMPFVFLLLVANLETVKTDKNKWLNYGMVMLTVFWLSHTLVRSAVNVYSWHKRSCQTESSI